MKHRDFLINDAIIICKRENIRFIQLENDTFLCDGKLKIGIKEALSYIYNKSK